MKSLKTPIAAALAPFAAAFVLAGCQDRQQPLDPVDVEFRAFPDASESQGALVIHKGETWWCGFLDGNGDVVFPLYPVNIVTNSQNGNAQHICHAFGVANPTGKALIFRPTGPDDLCGVWNGEGNAKSFPIEPENFLWTSKWHQVISASGEATLICNYKE